MKVIVIGLGVQGRKRSKIAAEDLFCTVDPLNEQADFKSVWDVPLNSFDAALCCIPDEPKFEILKYLLENKKHVLVEKPLWTPTLEQINILEDLANKNGCICYTAYNHRFEPHFINLKEILHSKELGEVYSCRMFYGNGTARLVKNSPWRDQGSGVIHDLGSHLLDTLMFFFGDEIENRNFNLRSCHRFENNSPDYAAFSSEGELPRIDCEMALVSWRNSFFCDVYGEKGSAHISSLCKWGPSVFTKYRRVLPSGKPEEHSITLAQEDPTWAQEYEYFKKECKLSAKTNLQKDKYILHTLKGFDEAK